ncbi:MFS-type transporter SLC18B1-like isoform X2 [Convolutriloba macropyga]|uniref:MFS-type transporter SLC18B1-like isoform X2 n=1 Tax=Convolutriloba macropyga TaxID=536237 RepID=UPI003F51C736
MRSKIKLDKVNGKLESGKAGSMVTLDQANPRGSSGKSLTARQKLYMITIVIAKFIHQLCSFWGAIVYPLEASKRGFSKLQIGTMLVFVSVASWATSIALSTFFLKFGGRRAAFNLFIGGSLSYGLLTIAIAASAAMTDKVMFGLTFTTFFSIRGMGQALLFSSVNTILLSEEFGDQVSFAKALDTLAYTLGSIFSFILSGYLYGQFGFMWVVIILGSLQSCVSLSYIYLLPKKTQNTDGAVNKIAATTNFRIILQVIQNPEILCTLMSHCLVYFTLFYLSPIFTPYVTSQFGLSAILTGMTACLPYLAMSLFGTSWSFVATTRFRRKICVTLPLIMFGITSWFSGPDPLITDEASLLTLCLTLFIGGGFLVSNLVLNTPELRDQAEDYGYDTEDIGVSATLASLLTSFEFLGEIVGPPCGGFFGDTFTVRRAFSIGGSFVGVIGVMRVIIYIVRYFTVKERVANLVRTKSSYV